MNYTIRSMDKDETPFLWQMLFYAAQMDEGGESLESANQPRPDAIRHELGHERRHRIDSGRKGHPQATGCSLSASHAREFTALSFCCPAFPELAVAVPSDTLGQGVGSRPLIRLLKEARAFHPGIVLSVRAQNPAKQLYERLGFTIVAEMANTIGGVSLVMKVDFSID